jgi:hypothetical protein
MKESLDYVFDIDTKDLVLLPNGFSEELDEATNEKFKWRNKIFSNEVLNLRKRLLDYLLYRMTNADKHHFQDMHSLYTKISSNW